MAHGCAIVTTDVGELPSTVDDASAIVLSTPTADTVKRAISRLVADEQLRLRLGRAALNQFKSKFNRERYVQRWADLLKV
jgi:glycosyltransferase involved in cell wall biosynthesis